MGTAQALSSEAWFERAKQALIALLVSLGLGFLLAAFGL